MKPRRRVVVVSSNRGLQRHATRALASAGCQVERCLVEREPLQACLAQPADMYILDAEGEKRELEWLIGELYDRQQETIPLLLSSDLRNSFLFELLASRGLNNLVARHGGLSASHEIIDEHELIVTCYKLFQRDIFGLQKYLPTCGVEIHHHDIGSTAEKNDAMGALESFLHTIDCYGAIVPAISLVADELLTNAIFNAPRDAQGNAKYAGCDRRDAIALLPEEQVQFRFACDGRYVALSVTDLFGSLNREVIVRYLEHTFCGRYAEVEEKAGGAGIGLYMVLNSITQLTFNIETQKRTEVIALFYIRSGARVFKTSGRSLNIFILQP